MSDSVQVSGAIEQWFTITLNTGRRLYAGLTADQQYAVWFPGQHQPQLFRSQNAVVSEIKACTALADTVQAGVTRLAFTPVTNQPQSSASSSASSSSSSSSSATAKSTPGKPACGPSLAGPSMPSAAAAAAAAAVPASSSPATANTVLTRTTAGPPDSGLAMISPAAAAAPMDLSSSSSASSSAAASRAPVVAAASTPLPPKSIGASSAASSTATPAAMEEDDPLAVDKKQIVLPALSPSAQQMQTLFTLWRQAQDVERLVRQFQKCLLLQPACDPATLKQCVTNLTASFSRFRTNLFGHFQNQRTLTMVETVQRMVAHFVLSQQVFDFDQSLDADSVHDAHVVLAHATAEVLQAWTQSFGTMTQLRVLMQQ